MAFKALEHAVAEIIITALSGHGDSRGVDSITFCGHGFGGAVAQLNSVLHAVNFACGDHHLKSAQLPAVTFAFRSLGDMAFEAIARAFAPRHFRYYVDRDPVDGLPRWTCTGLSFSSSVREAVEPSATRHIALHAAGPATIGTAASQRVASLVVSGYVFSYHHPLTTYAMCLSRHWAVGTPIGHDARDRKRRFFRSPRPEATVMGQRKDASAADNNC